MGCGGSMRVVYLQSGQNPLGQNLSTKNMANSDLSKNDNIFSQQTQTNSANQINEQASVNQIQDNVAIRTSDPTLDKYLPKNRQVNTGQSEVGRSCVLPINDKNSGANWRMSSISKAVLLSMILLIILLLALR